MQQWSLQDAKARLSEVVRLTVDQGPQEITLRGAPTVVLVSIAEYQRLIQPKPSFVDLIRHSPLLEVELDLSREQTSTREIEF